MSYLRLVLALADVHSVCSDMEKTFELPTCRHHHWRCRGPLLAGACAQPHLQTQLPRAFAIGARPDLVHDSEVPRFALVFVNCMIKPPPPHIWLLVKAVVTL